MVNTLVSCCNGDGLVLPLCQPTHVTPLSSITHTPIKTWTSKLCHQYTYFLALVFIGKYPPAYLVGVGMSTIICIYWCRWSMLVLYVSLYKKDLIKWHNKHSCPSGLRGSTQVRVYSYSWVRVPPNAVTFIQDAIIPIVGSKAWATLQGELSTQIPKAPTNQAERNSRIKEL